MMLFEADLLLGVKNDTAALLVADWELWSSTTRTSIFLFSSASSLMSLEGEGTST